MNKLIIVILFIVGCGGPSYTTKHGINVYDQTKKFSPSLASIENITDSVINYLGPTDLNGINLLLTNDPTSVPLKNDEPLFVNGYTDLEKRFIIITVQSKCFAESDYGHELAHFIKGEDWEHNDLKYWARSAIINLIIRFKICKNGTDILNEIADSVPNYYSK